MSLNSINGAPRKKNTAEAVRSFDVDKERARIDEIEKRAHEEIRAKGVDPFSLTQWNDGFMMDLRVARKRLKEFPSAPDKVKVVEHFQRKVGELEGNSYRILMHKADAEVVTRPPTKGQQAPASAPPAPAQGPAQAPQQPHAPQQPQAAPQPVAPNPPQPAPTPKAKKKKQNTPKASPNNAAPAAPSAPQAPEPPPATAPEPPPAPEPEPPPAITPEPPPEPPAQPEERPDHLRQPGESEETYAERLKGIDFSARLNAEFPEIPKTADSTPTETEVSEKGKIAAATAEIQTLTRGQRRLIAAQKAGTVEAFQKMRGAEQEYLSLVKEVEKTGTKGISAADKVQRTVRLHKLKEQYDAERVEYGKTLTKSARNRLDEMGIDDERKERVLARYNRLVRFNEVVRPAQELELQARTEGLSERKRGLFGRMLGKAAQFNQWLNKTAGERGAKALIAGTTALALTGATAVIGGLSGMALTVGAGYGAWRVGRAVLGSLFTGTAAGKWLGKRSERKGREKHEALRAQLASAGRSEGDLDINTLLADEVALRERAKILAASESRIQRNKRRANLLSAFAFGGITGAAMSTELADHIMHSFGNQFVLYGPHGAGAGAEHFTNGGRAAGLNHEHFTNGGRAAGVGLEQGHGVNWLERSSVTAHNGDGGIRLLNHLQENIRENPHVVKTPALEAFLKIHPTVLAHQLDLYRPGAPAGLENLQVPDGSTLGFNNANELMLTLKNGYGITLMDAHGKIVPHPGGLGNYIALQEHAPAVTPEAAPSPGLAPETFAQANHGIAPETDYPAASGPPRNIIPPGFYEAVPRAEHMSAPAPEPPAPSEAVPPVETTPHPDVTPTHRPDYTPEAAPHQTPAVETTRPGIPAREVAPRVAAPAPEVTHGAASLHTPEAAQPTPAPEVVHAAAPNMPVDAPTYPTDVAAFESEFGAHVDPQAMHIYHQPDGTLIAYGGPDMQKLHDFAARYAIEHNATVITDGSYNLEGDHVAQALKFTRSVNGTAATEFITGADSIPDPNMVDQVIQ